MLTASSTYALWLTFIRQLSIYVQLAAMWFRLLNQSKNANIHNHFADLWYSFRIRLYMLTLRFLRGKLQVQSYAMECCSLVPMWFTLLQSDALGIISKLFISNRLYLLQDSFLLWYKILIQWSLFICWLATLHSSLIS